MTLDTTTTSADRQKRQTLLIIDRVAAQHGFTRAQLLAPGRTAKVVVPRQMAMSLARELTEASSPDLASWFNREDHGTVLHAVDANRRRCRKEPRFRALYAKMKAGLTLSLKNDGEPAK